MDEANAAAASAARRWSAGIVVLAVAWGIVQLIVNPAASRDWVYTWVAVPGGLAILTARGLRWARGLLTAFSILYVLNIPDILSNSPLPLGSLPNLALMMYGAGMLWCVAALYRQPAARYFPAKTVDRTGPTSAPMRHARQLVMFWAIVITFVASYGLMFWLVERVAGQWGVRPDFGTNGLNYYYAGAGLISGVLFPLYLALILYIVIPKLHQLTRCSRARTLTSAGLTMLVLLPVLLFFFYFFLASTQQLDRIAACVLVGPPLVGTAIASYCYLRCLDAQSSQGE